MKLTCPFVVFILSLIFEQIVAFKIGSFNVQIFGKKKMNNRNIADILTKIIRRYDIMFMMEIRDSSEEAVFKLLEKVNKQARSSKEVYGLVVSKRLGDSISKEQYAYFYRKRRVKIEDYYTYSDPKNVLAREPLIVKFKISRSIRFVIIGVHISPEEVIPEMNEFPNIVAEVKKKWNLSNILIAGDFNADCGYLPKKDYDEIKLMQDSRYHWLIDNDVDTTTKNSHCAYDRFIVTGEKMLQKICPGSSKVYRFDKEMNLDAKKVTYVSDHYPIELNLAVGKKGCDQ